MTIDKAIEFLGKMKRIGRKEKCKQILSGIKHIDVEYEDGTKIRYNGKD